MIGDNIVFLGSTRYSEELLKCLIENGATLSAIFSIPKNFSISYSKKKIKNINHVDLSNYAKKLSIPYYEIDSQENQKLIDYKEKIESLSPNVILAAGWYYMIPKEIRMIPKHGAWGLHASLLPNYAGGAPLVWAMINGEKKTGVTLFRMDSGVDDGDIIYQESFNIAIEDTIKNVMDKALLKSKKILLKALSKEDVDYFPQDKTKIKIYPQRSPNDGEIDWSWEEDRIKNFVRAQTKPYPGAWTMKKNKKIIFWKISNNEIKKFKNGN